MPSIWTQRTTPNNPNDSQRRKAAITLLRDYSEQVESFLQDKALQPVVRESGCVWDLDQLRDLLDEHEKTIAPIEQEQRRAGQIKDEIGKLVFTVGYLIDQFDQVNGYPTRATEALKLSTSEVNEALEMLDPTKQHADAISASQLPSSPAR